MSFGKSRDRDEAQGENCRFGSSAVLGNCHQAFLCFYWVTSAAALLSVCWIIVGSYGSNTIERTVQTSSPGASRATEDRAIDESRFARTASRRGAAILADQPFGASRGSCPINDESELQSTKTLNAMGYLTNQQVVDMLLQQDRGVRSGVVPQLECGPYALHGYNISRDVLNANRRIVLLWSRLRPDDELEVSVDPDPAKDTVLRRVGSIQYHRDE